MARGRRRNRPRWKGGSGARRRLQHRLIQRIVDSHRTLVMVEDQYGARRVDDRVGPNQYVFERSIIVKVEKGGTGKHTRRTHSTFGKQTPPLEPQHGVGAG